MLVGLHLIEQRRNSPNAAHETNSRGLLAVNLKPLTQTERLLPRVGSRVAWRAGAALCAETHGGTFVYSLTREGRGLQDAQKTDHT